MKRKQLFMMSSVVMKRYLHTCWFFLPACFLFAACNPTLKLQVLQAAQVSLPSHIKQIGIVNRTIPGKDDRFLNVVEGLLSGESIGADRIGAENAMEGVRQQLMSTDRFVVSLPNLNLDGSHPFFLQGPLNKEVVNAICAQHHLDAIIVLEMFDSDSRIIVNPRNTETRVNGKRVVVTDFVANAEMNVQTSWKVYDDSTDNIIDQHQFVNVARFSGAGPNPDAARMALPGKRNAINQAGLQAGIAYGTRIAPFWTTVIRQYYRKGNDSMKEAAALSKKGDWLGAVAIWKKEILNKEEVIAGRAYYNLAVACEREGNLDLAIEYATQANQRYHLRRASTYLSLLHQRVNNRLRLRHQYEGN
ncbi:MAG: DUF6340 family protein [Bacteroidota bacterium]